MTEIPVATGEAPLALVPRMANRHGLVAGATGTGKTVTLRVLAEGFSRLGVPVFLADVKGDLAGMALPATGDAKLAARAQELGVAGWAPEPTPVTFWEIGGTRGHPVRTTVSDMGPLLLARILDLNEVQSGLLSLVFRVADDAGLLLLDLKDLRAMLQHVGERAKELQKEYGNASAASVGAIQRALLALEQEGGDALFGEPALELDDLVRTEDGRGAVNVLVADRLVRAPRTYATFLLWLLAELFENLPEVGDPEKPRLVFFFDEAHLLFDDAPEALRDRVEQVVRLVRSKGVGVYFVTQSPLDLPEAVLGQLGNRVQHALRAFTPRDQRAVRAAAETFRESPGLDVAEAITQLAVGEALVSFLDASGAPSPVQRARVHPPRSRLGPLAPDEQRVAVSASPLQGKYEREVDRESAYEQLRDRAARAPTEPPDEGRSWRDPGTWGLGGSRGAGRGRSRSAETPLEAIAKSAARAAGTQLGREIMRGVLGSIFGGGGRRR
jgi:DNA helicase HerA-like ATPase